MLTTAQKKRILRRAARNIRRGRGRNYDQSIDWLPYEQVYRGLGKETRPTCGSVGCLGGHLDYACEQLGLKQPRLWQSFLPGTGKEQFNRCVIFADDAQWWPVKFWNAYRLKKTQRGRATVAADFLEAIADGKVWPW